MRRSSESRRCIISLYNSCIICSSPLYVCCNGKKCERCGYVIHDSLFSENDSCELVRRKRNIVFSWLLKRKNTQYDHNVLFYYYDRLSEKTNDPNIEDSAYKINVEPLIKNYPHTLLQRIDHILLNIVSKHNDMGIYFPISDTDSYMMLCETDNNESEISYVIQMMAELGYLIAEEDTLDERVYRCQITLAGWKRIEELNTIKKETNQAFIAMKFSTETEHIATAFKIAISQAGYVPYKMDEIEHNNQIVPEMFFEISRSKLLVIDVTIPNLGAYYEAGYAQALGKEVIVCCEKSKADKVHFDISQKNMIMWDDCDELVKKLTRRIEATIGKV